MCKTTVEPSSSTNLKKTTSTRPVKTPLTKKTTSSSLASALEESTTSTTVAKCGNGLIDPGEDCDIGMLCKKGDGVCAITNATKAIAACMANGSCEGSLRAAATGKYDLGGCDGCFGPKDIRGCHCIPQTLLRKTTTSTIARSPKPKTTTTLFKNATTVFGDYHFACNLGKCVKVDGKGTSQCMTDPQCQHKECKGAECVLVNGPGRDKCDASHGGCWHYVCDGNALVKENKPGTDEKCAAG
jgi:hypothetical protein